MFSMFVRLQLRSRHLILAMARHDAGGLPPNLPNPRFINSFPRESFQKAQP